MRTTLAAVPEAESAEVKEVYAFYGLAAYEAQVLEKGLVTLLAILETDGLRITRAEYDVVFARADVRTLGRLIRRARERLPIAPAVEALLVEALRERNHLIHHFFADHAAAFVTDPGRVQMIARLRVLVDLFQRTDRQVHALSEPFMQKRGLTPAAVERVGADMIAAFLASVAQEVEE